MDKTILDPVSSSKKKSQTRLFKFQTHPKKENKIQIKLF